MLKFTEWPKTPGMTSIRDVNGQELVSFPKVPRELVISC